jgi:thiamine biosynthesis lipoprotein
MALAASCVLAACARPPSAETFRGPTMGTTYSVQVTQLPDGLSRGDLQSAIDAVLDETNRVFSTYDPDSEVSRFNSRQETSPVPVSEQLASLVQVSERIGAATDGAFDITVAPLVRAWGFGSGSVVEGGTPGPDQLATLRSSVGHDKLQLVDGGRALQKLVPTLQLDFDGIAPGRAVDEIVGRFEALGVGDYLVEIGGEVRARGQSPAGRAWRVAVEVPVAGDRKPYTLVELDGLAVSTSGDYRDFRIVDGHRVSHTIDPRTGAPVTHGLASVCVVHPSAAHADAYATAIMVLGPEEGLATATRLGLAALLIERTADGQQFTERTTPAFDRLRRDVD